MASPGGSGGSEDGDNHTGSAGFSSDGDRSRSPSEEGRSRRRKLEQYNTLVDAVDLIRNSKHIIVLSGAGVSTSCGIPDFRSKNGIYAQIAAAGEYQLDEPGDLFDISYFEEHPQVFYSFAKQIYPGAYEPSQTHRWVKGLEDRGKLLRQYTQNIDGLDVKAGVKNVLQCHGSFDTASCIRCGAQYPGSTIESNILNSTVPECPRCKAQRELDDEARRKAPKKKKRKWDEDDESSDEDPWDTGHRPILKPRITFFGENVFAMCPEFGPSVMADREKVDLVLIIGTSLKVAPVADILQVLPPDIPQILINMTPILHFEMDIMLLGESDKIVRWLSAQLDWDQEEVKGEEDIEWRSATEEFSHLHIFAPKDGPAPFLTFEIYDAESGESDDEEEVGEEIEEKAGEKVGEGEVGERDTQDLKKQVDGEGERPLHLEEIIGGEFEKAVSLSPQSSPRVLMEERYPEV